MSPAAGTSLETDVLIAGGGPFGLMLAIELGRRGVRSLLVDPKPGTALNPQANATQARTMEHFRRLGFSAEIRAQGLPSDHPTDIAYFTRYAGYELARLRLPTAAQAISQVRSLTGSWSAAELPHRVSQKFVEVVLLRHAQSFDCNDIRYGWRLAHFDQQHDGVAAVVLQQAGGSPLAVHARYLIGADGARSMVRNRLGIAWDGATGTRRDFMGGQMFAVYLRAPAFYEVMPHDRAWMYVSVNPQRRAFMASVDGHTEFAFHAALHPDEDGDAWTERDARRVFAQALGREIALEVLSFGTWTAGHSLVAQSFQQDRVFIGGDAAHLFTPTGGLGYNTAVEDGVNLGWKLASVISGVSSSRLLDSYQAERQPLAWRNTAYARQFADSVGLFPATSLLEVDSEAGAAERGRASEHLNAHAKLEFNIPGVTFGARYDNSPVVVSDGTLPPSDHPNMYSPSACPGGRPPHAWLEDGRSLFDAFGPEWTLLVLGPEAPDIDSFIRSARALGLELAIVRLPASALSDLYDAPLALIRPDQIVVWRGHRADTAQQILAQATGN